MRQAYRIKDGFSGALGHGPGTICYYLRGYDYGLAMDDTRMTGKEHVSMTLNPDGSYPSFTVERAGLEKVDATASASVEPQDKAEAK